MKKSYAVLGLGNFGMSIATELEKAGAEVLVVDIDEERVHDMADMVTCAVKADVCDVTSMKSLGLSNMDAVVVAITKNLDASVMGTILAKESGVNYIIAKAQNAIHAKILEKVGADKVIIPEKETGVRIARNMTCGNFVDFIELSDRARILEITMKKEWIGKTLKTLDFRKKYGINVVAIREKGEVIINVDPDGVFTEDMTLIVIADKRDVDKLV